ncbi:MAG: alpha/beta hydrolase [Pseudomonadota bacterium]
MNWKVLLTAALVLLVAVPAALYLGSYDWSRQHSASVSRLPVWSARSGDGEYRIEAGGFEFRVRVAGMDNDGPAILLLHGFPETSLMWQPLLSAAAGRGFRAAAFDQRGYSPGARPEAVEQYHLSHLSGDAIAVADALGFQRFHLVGHDWGAAVGWYTAARVPARIESYSALAIPHLEAFFDAVQNDPVQRERSAYFDFNRRPFVPEFVAMFAGQRILKRLLQSLPAAQRTEYLGLLAEPGALTAALNWYRAMDIAELREDPLVTAATVVPTLFLWGERDVVVVPAAIESQRLNIDAPYEARRLDAGHALIQQQPAAVIDAVLGHVSRHRRGAAGPAATTEDDSS